MDCSQSCFSYSSVPSCEKQRSSKTYISKSCLSKAASFIKGYPSSLVNRGQKSIHLDAYQIINFFYFSHNIVEIYGPLQILVSDGEEMEILFQGIYCPYSQQKMLLYVIPQCSSTLMSLCNSRMRILAPHYSDC